MFRKMRRFKQQLPEAECREVLREQKLMKDIAREMGKV